MELLLLIELNDKTHTKYNRMKRDYSIDQILSQANIPLLKFYTNYPNEKDYIYKRIQKTLLGALNNE